jgi:hypothetical protein
VNQKVLIIVLVALVVIFVITLGIGGCHSPGSGRDPHHPGAVGALKGLQGKPIAKLGDKVTATCAPPGAVTLAVNGSCVITVAKSAFFRRSTRIIFRNCFDPPSCQLPRHFFLFTVSVVPKKGPKEDKDPLAGKTCFATAIGRAGGTLTLSGSATITLTREECPRE